LLILNDVANPAEEPVVQVMRLLDNDEWTLPGGLAVVEDQSRRVSAPHIASLVAAGTKFVDGVRLRLDRKEAA
jgi:hypothetical protein